MGLSGSNWILKLPFLVLYLQRLKGISPVAVTDILFYLSGYKIDFRSFAEY